MSLWNDDLNDDPNESQYGWGICSECGADCEEDDYDDGLKQSTCTACRERKAEAERHAAEVFARR